MEARSISIAEFSRDLVARIRMYASVVLRTRARTVVALSDAFGMLKDPHRTYVEEYLLPISEARSVSCLAPEQLLANRRPRFAHEEHFKVEAIYRNANCCWPPAVYNVAGKCSYIGGGKWSFPRHLVNVVGLLLRAGLLLYHKLVNEKNDSHS